MLRELYVTSSLSLRDMERILGYSLSTIHHRLVELGVEMRERGGANNTSRTLSLVSDQELSGNGREIAEKFGVSIGTVLIERARRKV